jgi:hypothetical protein
MNSPIAVTAPLQALKSDYSVTSLISASKWKTFANNVANQETGKADNQLN